MKKVILGILSLVYITVASGIVINLHYCMGRISEVGYIYKASDQCDKCGMKNMEGCCHSEFKIVKISDDQQQVKANFGFNQPPVSINHYSFSFLQPLQGFEQTRAVSYYPPPDNNATPLFLSNSVFRI